MEHSDRTVWLVEQPSRERFEARIALTRQVAEVLAPHVEEGSDAISALLSVACAYIRLADPDLRMRYADDAAELIRRDVLASLA